MNDLARVRARHDDIPQDALPGLDIVVADGSAVDAPKARPEKTVAWAVCPSHTADPSHRDGMTGLIAVTADTYAFRRHNKRVGNVTVPCPGSGAAATPEEPKS